VDEITSAQSILFEPGYYVTSDGHVFSTKYKKGHETKELAQTISNSGYLYVRINDKKYYVHRLVAATFIPNPEDKREVNHKDLCKTNNDVSNLEWTTPSENVRHAKRNCKRKSKTSSNAGYLFCGESLLGWFESLQQAKLYCKENIHCSICTIKRLNVNWNAKIVFIREEDIVDFDPFEFWKVHDAQTEDALRRHRLQNIELKGYYGTLYKGNKEIGKYRSIREASKAAGYSLRKTKRSGIYKVYDYVFVNDKV
jgi:hypothetical protein